MIEQKSNEITDLTRKLSEAVDSAERSKSDKESLTKEVAKLQEQWRTFKQDTSVKYETFNKQLNQQDKLLDSLKMLQQL